MFQLWVRPMKRTDTACRALLAGAFALLSTAALAQQGAVPAQPIPQTAPVLPPTSPVAPGQQPEAFGRFLTPGTTVLQRPRPEYDPLGLRFGNWFFYPKLEVDELYNDNIFATRSGRKDDFITVISPTLDLRSRVPDVYDVDVSAGANIGRYARFDSESYEDGFGAVDGSYNITRNLIALGGVRVQRLHEERDSPDRAGGAAEPTKLSTASGTAGIASRGLRIGWQLDAGVRREDYDNVAAIGGGTIDQSERDVTIATVNATGTYELAPNYQAFIRGGYNHRDHDNIITVDRTSDGYRIDVGARIDLGGVTFAEAFIGYLDQEYKSPLSSISGVDFGGRLVWNASQITTVTAIADRRVQDSNSFVAGGGGIFSPGYLRSNVGATVDHELRRNVLLNGFVNYQNDDYEGIDRTDDRFDLGGGVRYMFTRNLYLGGSYTFSHRDSSGINSGSANSFERNLFLIRLGAQL
jgi:hypothetical protein